MPCRLRARFFPSFSVSISIFAVSGFSAELRREVRQREKGGVHAFNQFAIGFGRLLHGPQQLRTFQSVGPIPNVFRGHLRPGLLSASFGGQRSTAAIFLIEPLHGPMCPLPFASNIPNAIT